jgi:ribosome biogenesis GTPase
MDESIDLDRPAGLDDYGWSESVSQRLDTTLALHPELREAVWHVGRVLRPDSATALTLLTDGPALLPVRPQQRPVTVGDWVLESGGMIAAVLPRSSLLQRRDPTTGNAQLLAANVDIVALACGLDRPVKAGRIERAAALAWDAGATPLVVLTKTDLVADPVAEADRVSGAHPMLEVITTSTATGEGLDRLRSMAAGGTLVLLGESGAGKSTLVNALCEGPRATAAAGPVEATGQVRKGDAKGRHTTTHRYLHLIPTGGCVIDTPGLREVGLWGDPSSVDRAFSDIDALAAGCRFRDCTHEHEPGCAVQEAVDDGQLAPDRLRHFHALRLEARSAALRADEHARRQEGRRFGRMAREAQRLKYGGGPGSGTQRP